MAAPSLELKDLVKLPVAAQWKDLGVQLGVPQNILDDIQADQKNSPHVSQECLRDMFNWWLNNGHDVTKEKLDCALRDIEKTHGEESTQISQLLLICMIVLMSILHFSDS